MERLTGALASVRRSHGRSSSARTELVGNVLTCTTPRQSGLEDHDGAYRNEAVSAVVRATRQQVSSFTQTTGSDGNTVEVFTLEASSGRGRPGGFRHRG